jgi:hypothetical protein
MWDRYGCSMWVQLRHMREHSRSCTAPRSASDGGAATGSASRFESECDGYCLRRCPLGYDRYEHARIRAMATERADATAQSLSLFPLPRRRSPSPAGAMVQRGDSKQSPLVLTNEAMS